MTSYCFADAIWYESNSAAALGPTDVSIFQLHIGNLLALNRLQSCSSFIMCLFLNQRKEQNIGLLVEHSYTETRILYSLFLSFW